jgi:mono/diheme cytochrome c family protein
LSADERRRFEAGRDLYANLCAACHQLDGRGSADLAPPLVGSLLALAPADVPARVLINGKDGAVGLMPPLGASLSDDQIAAVLTYIRREWGQRGTPVDSNSVGGARRSSAARTRPWTDDDLAALLEPRLPASANGR